MKKWLSILMCLAMLFAAAACSSASSESASTPKEIDVDLTALSSTIVYSTVNDRLVKPEDYIGQTVKMNGAFAYYHDEAADHYYFACIIADATACCQQGIEFELEGEHTFPEDYPEPEENITVVGTFDTYDEAGKTYCTLRNARFVTDEA